MVNPFEFLVDYKNNKTSKGGPLIKCLIPSLSNHSETVIFLNFLHSSWAYLGGAWLCLYALVHKEFLKAESSKSFAFSQTSKDIGFLLCEE